MPDIQLGDLPAHLAVPPVGRPVARRRRPPRGVRPQRRHPRARRPPRRRGLPRRRARPLPRRGSARCLLATFRSLARARGQPFDDIEAVRRRLAAPRGLHRPRRRDRLLHGRRLRAADRRARLRRRQRRTTARCRRTSTPPYRAHARSSRASAGATSSCAGAAARVDAALSARGRGARRQGVPGRRALVLQPPQRGAVRTRVLRVAGVGFHQPSAEDAWGRILRFFDAHLGTGERQSGEGVVDRS